ncbi:hypothetical protein GCM10027262_17360 [Nocardia tengchongensis]
MSHFEVIVRVDAGDEFRDDSGCGLHDGEEYAGRPTDRGIGCAGPTDTGRGRTRAPGAYPGLASFQDRCSGRWLRMTATTSCEETGKVWVEKTAGL